MIKSLLVANRGEIACRVIRTARRMGVRTVAVYSDADANALHVRSADEAVHIGPAAARESYLVGERIIAAALTTGAEAIHPGYGFLSENAEFAQAVLDAGLVWVGPKPHSITAMGLKDAAKARMIAAGVPVTPGYLGEDQSAERLQAEADAIGYPVLIKAVAGGGGKGMRRVDAAADFAEALASCRREAASSFGDDRVLIEKYILSPRHIEVQVFGDAHGNVVHLFERDCSLQRRHQKVIEEAPAPGMDEATREAVCAAAVRAAKAVDYEGAGTIEFIADGSEGLRADRIWFMEMNTRLQVEHPVTEEITGVDLVEWQLRVASGEPLPKRQDELSINGWAMEARLYAEDPTRGFLPSIGRVDDFHFPHHHARIDTGVEAGAEISPFYDPMIAKLIVHRPTRTEAVSALRETLDEGIVGPLVTNSGFLWRLLGHAAFEAGVVDTGLIERNLETLATRPEPSREGLALAAMRLAGTPGATPWSSRSGFRMNAAPRRDVRLSDQFGRTFTTELPPEPAFDYWPGEDATTIDEGGERFRVRLARADGGSGGAASDGAILAPMPGKVISVDVSAGQSVTKGQKLMVLEAMKMEHALTAPFDGVVAELNAAPGGQVQVEALLAKIEKGEA
ncbi:Carbamoyl-phosphate synthase L chain, ATP-binding protein [Novosphingobium aromaticivorans DSM 12444]|uniref:Carbamoyl-phosphate synthase L chain, ATP-binding protein n=1 Tax=Novosphingobium aromaticivorans (strain ATCC 700278 / DSM 12444 / CCUG 56034 / CIP 105152 / NBRC 16084 / F199) TaxID=279238 RepID=Q2G7U1_NOVAD|nr:acetyl/propionyl/methylcrotonyl-CoA carboxylase subunit alpha [Novosphingobium aromaticivorans]ABD26082.1 Carbamoyl-phosphate synthase L chain, ATP-binding protein [Novosphingobium aromaticivorans DSM 12444]SCY59874.1 3-methylcrotonyl-CoA carboxylase alpha subunit [Novosphingobium aromaticivorans]